MYKCINWICFRNELEGYLDLLVRNYNTETIDNLMCRNIISVNWKGELFDCDFNQQLDIPVPDKGITLLFWLEVKC